MVLFVSFNVLETMFFCVKIPQVLDDPHRCLQKNKKITKCMSENLNYYDIEDDIFGNHIVTNDQMWDHLRMKMTLHELTICKFSIKEKVIS